LAGRGCCYTACPITVAVIVRIILAVLVQPCPLLLINSSPFFSHALVGLHTRIPLHLGHITPIGNLSVQDISGTYTVSRYSTCGVS
jgi:hypothetical protein